MIHDRTVTIMTKEDGLNRASRPAEAMVDFDTLQADIVDELSLHPVRGCLPWTGRVFEER